MKNILITGGAGFIGKALARKLVLYGHRVKIFDNFNSQIHSIDKLPKEIASDVELIKADIRNLEALRSALFNTECVVHLAAETGTGQSMYEIQKYFDVNVQGTAVLLDLLQNDYCSNSVRSIVVASSRAIYGEGAYNCKSHGTVFPIHRTRERMSLCMFDPICPFCAAIVDVLPTSESAPFMPMSIYGLTKQVQEQAILMFARSRGINCFGLRYQNVYGPGQSLKNPYTGILAVFSNLARQNQCIEIYEDGLESRDFVYIDDVVEATMRSIDYPDQYVGPVNVGSGKAISVLTVAEEIKTYFNSESPIKVTGSYRIGDIRHNIADLSKLKEVLGFAPEVTFKTGLSNFLNWASEQSPEDQSAYLRSVNELASRGLMGQTSVNLKRN